MFVPVWIFIISFSASFLCVATGGAGLIVTPALILFGITPQVAVATDIFGMLGSSLAAFRKFRALGELDVLFGVKIAAIATAGVLIGTHLMSVANPELLKTLVAIAILIGVSLLLFKSKLGEKKIGSPSAIKRVLGFLLLFIAGLWGGAVGGGFLVLGTFALVLFFGKTLIQSAATLTVLSFSVGLVATLTFASKGLINYELGIIVMLGKALGANLGASFATRLNPRVIKYAFSIIVVIVSLKLLLG